MTRATGGITHSSPIRRVLSLVSVLGMMATLLVGLPASALAAGEEVSFSLSSSTVVENVDGGAHSVGVTLTVPRNLVHDVVVDVTAANGSATGADYTFTSPTTLVFDADTYPDGGTQSVSIALIDDSLIEGDETIDLELWVISGPATAVTPTAHTVIITDNEAKATVEFTTPTS